MKKLNLLATTMSLALLLNVTLPAVQAEAAGLSDWLPTKLVRVFQWHSHSVVRTFTKQTPKSTPKVETQPKVTPTPQPTSTPQPAPAPQPQPVSQPQPTSQVNEQAEYALHAYEVKVVELVNAERAKYNLAPLKSNLDLAKVARLKSQDMRDQNYFDHQSPTYGSPFDMMKKFGITYRAAGENIAAGQRSPEEVVEGWMNSEGHRKNILSSNFTEIGVGYVSGGSYGTYWTQEFIGK